MKAIFLDKTISFLKKYRDYSEDDIEKLAYGLEGIYLTITKLVIIFIMAFILKIVKEVCVLLLFFNIIRYTGFGFHAEKSYQCLIFSLLGFVIFPKIMLSIDIPLFAEIIIFIICVISYLLFAPADTVKRPLPNKRKRKIRKIATIIISVIYIIFFYSINVAWLKVIVLCSLLIEAVVINPLTYKLFGLSYNNYKHYKT